CREASSYTSSCSLTTILLDNLLAALLEYLKEEHKALRIIRGSIDKLLSPTCIVSPKGVLHTFCRYGSHCLLLSALHPLHQRFTGWCILVAIILVVFHINARSHNVCHIIPRHTHLGKCKAMSIQAVLQQVVGVLPQR